MEAASHLMQEHKRKKSREASFSVSTLGEVAAFFGLSEQTVKQWTTRNPPLPGKHGDWPLREIVQWREAWLTQADLQARQRQQNYDLGQIKLERDQLDLAEKRKQLLRREDVELWAATALTEMREMTLQLKEMLTASAPAELKDHVRTETERHLRDALATASMRLQMDQIGDDSQRQ